MTNSNYVIELFIKHCNRDVKHTFENLGYLGNPKMILMFKQMFTEELSVYIFNKVDIHYSKFFYRILIVFDSFS